MACFSPYFKREKGYPYCLPFPCGRCLYCRIQKKREWKLRITIEAMQYTSNAFLTLTYNPANIPEGYNLSPQHLTLFFKRLRYFLPYPIKYYACGEYGEKRGRPHYHAVVFGLQPEHFKLVESCWSYGYVKVEVPRNSASVGSYVAGYVTKKIGTMQAVSQYYGGRIPPFQRQSKGIGLSIVEKLPFYSSIIRIGKESFYIGRYLRNKLAERFNVLEQVKEEGLSRLSDKMIGIVENFIIPDRMFGSLEYNSWQSFYKGTFEVLKHKDLLFNKRSGFV